MKHCFGFQVISKEQRSRKHLSAISFKIIGTWTFLGSLAHYALVSNATLPYLTVKPSHIKNPIKRTASVSPLLQGFRTVRKYLINHERSNLFYKKHAHAHQEMIPNQILLWSKPNLPMFHIFFCLYLRSWYQLLCLRNVVSVGNAHRLHPKLQSPSPSLCCSISHEHIELIFWELFHISI